MTEQITDGTGESQKGWKIDNDNAGHVKIVSASGNEVDVNESGQLHTVMRGHVCDNNSTTTLLLAGETWTGAAEDILDYGGISLFITSDVESAVDGIEVQYSKDGLTNWRTAEFYTLVAGAEKWFSPPSFGAYLRIKYTNGISDQTSFELTTTLRKTPFKWSSHNIEDPIKDEDDAELMKSVITGKKANGDYDNVSLTNGGNMKISIEEFETQVSTNNNTQLNTSLYDVDGIGPAEIDNATNTLQIIDYEHHEIHSGSHYFICDYALNQSASAVIEFVLTTDNSTSWMHSTLDFSASEGATLEVYKDTTGVTGGTPITPVNNNGNSLNTSNATVVKDPSSITSDGTRAAGFIAGGGRTAGFNKREREIVLEQNTVYLFRISSLAVSNDIGWCFEWYEHTDKN